MPDLCAPDRCCGCSACQAACPKSAITMRPDREGFPHPHVDGRRCVNCRLCEKACPVLHRPEAREPLAVYAAKAKDDGLRAASSSGGLFSLLARKVLSEGGVVFGAAIGERDLMVHHRAAENETELAALRGSKYVQSDMEGVYVSVRKALTAGRPVMFAGTPCQIAALRRYLGREYEHLLCVDVVCHAVPSPLAWRKYLDGFARGPVTDVSFRCKRHGWKNFAMALRFADGTEHVDTLDRDAFLRGFLGELYNRPSCHDCPFRELRSGSDITLADYWNVSGRFPDMDDDRGTSLVLVNTEKGRRAYDAVLPALEVRASDFADAVRINPALVRAHRMHPKRRWFFRLVRLPFVNFGGLVDRMLPC